MGEKMKVDVYKKKEDKDDDRAYYNWKQKSEYAFSIEVSNMDSALDLINNSKKLENLSVEDGDFLVRPSKTPYVVCDNCSRLKKLWGTTFNVTYYSVIHK